jgi:hypothetical protein
MPLIAVLHIEVVTRPYVMSKISFFMVRTFDVAAPGEGTGGLPPESSWELENIGPLF